jgi:hypothetical protein
LSARFSNPGIRIFVGMLLVLAPSLAKRANLGAYLIPSAAIC